MHLPYISPLHLSYQVRERRDPLCSLARSDSSNLDAVFEHLRRTNPDIEPAMAIGTLVPWPTPSPSPSPSP